MRDKSALAPFATQHLCHVNPLNYSFYRWLAFDRSDTWSGPLLHAITHLHYELVDNIALHHFAQLEWLRNSRATSTWTPRIVQLLKVVRLSWLLCMLRLPQRDRWSPAPELAAPMFDVCTNDSNRMSKMAEINTMANLRIWSERVNAALGVFLFHLSSEKEYHLNAFKVHIVSSFGTHIGGEDGRGGR